MAGSSSAWVKATLEEQPQLSIKTDKIDWSIFRPDRTPALPNKGVRRIDMTKVNYVPTCQGDVMFWEAACKLYKSRIMYIPKVEAHRFVETCWNMHICKTHSIICRCRIDFHLTSENREPYFADVVVLCLLYGHVNVGKRSWYRKWLMKYNADFEMPSRVQGLYLPENLPSQTGGLPRKSKTPMPDSMQTGNKAKRTFLVLPDTESDDEEPWVTMSMSQAKTPPPPPPPPNPLKRQSAVNATLRTKELYKNFPTGRRQSSKRDPIVKTPTSSCRKRQRQTIVLDSSDDEDMTLNKSKVPKKEVVSQQKRKHQQENSTTDIESVTEAEDIKIALASTADELIAQFEQGQKRSASLDQAATVLETSEQNEANTCSAQLTSESVESSETPTVDKRFEASEELSLQDPEPVEHKIPIPIIGDDYLKRAKEKVAEQQGIIAQMEGLKMQISVKTEQKQNLEKDIEALMKEYESACARLKAVTESF